MGIRKRLRQEGSAYLFILPALCLFAIFLVKPMIESVMLSFFKVGLRDRTFTGFNNYLALFRSHLFWMALKNTLRFVVIIVPSQIVFSLGIALMLSSFSRRVQSLFRGMFYLPVVLAGVVMTCAWWWIFNPLGPLNYFSSLLGLPQILWLSRPNWARLAVILVVLNWSVGVGVILYLTALVSIPKQLYEAAEIDGANSIQKFFKVTVPLILPITVFVLITTTVGIFQIWAAIFTLTSGGPIHATRSLVLHIFNLGFVSFDFGQASACATILFLLILSTAYLQFKRLNKQIEF